MIAAVNVTIEKLFKSSDCEKVLLFSDSNAFLQAEHPPYVEILPGKVGHVSRQKNSQAADKAFLDLIVMSKAKAIYSIIGDDLYTSGFSRDASFIGNKPFRRVNVEKI